MHLRNTSRFSWRTMNMGHGLCRGAQAVLLGVLCLQLAACSRGDVEERGGGPSSVAGSAASAAAGENQAPVAIARGKIDVESGVLNLNVATSGQIEEVAVHEGQNVEKGQLLLRLSDDAMQADIAVSRSELQLAETRQKAKAARLMPLKQTLERWQTAAHEGAADLQKVDEAAQELRDAQSESDMAAAEVVVAKSKLQQLQVLQKRHELRAPVAATVVRLQIHAGMQITPDTKAVALLPKTPLIVRAELNESFVGAVKPGMKASVVIDGDGTEAPSLPTAKLVRISPMYGTARLQDDVQRGPVRVVECVLQFDQVPAGVRVGQNVRVSFHE